MAVDSRARILSDNHELKHRSIASNYKHTKLKELVKLPAKIAHTHQHARTSTCCTTAQ